MLNIVAGVLTILFFMACGKTSKESENPSGSPSEPSESSIKSTDRVAKAISTDLFGNEISWLKIKNANVVCDDGTSVLLANPTYEGASESFEIQAELSKNCQMTISEIWSLRGADAARVFQAFGANAPNGGVLLFRDTEKTNNEMQIKVVRADLNTWYFAPLNGWDLSKYKFKLDTAVAFGPTPANLPLSANMTTATDQGRIDYSRACKSSCELSDQMIHALIDTRVTSDWEWWHAESANAFVTRVGELLRTGTKIRSFSIANKELRGDLSFDQMPLNQTFFTLVVDRHSPHALYQLVTTEIEGKPINRNWGVGSSSTLNRNNTEVDPKEIENIKDQAYRNIAELYLSYLRGDTVKFDPSMPKAEAFKYAGIIASNGSCDPATKCQNCPNDSNPKGVATGCFIDAMHLIDNIFRPPGVDLNVAIDVTGRGAKSIGSNVGSEFARPFIDSMKCAAEVVADNNALQQLMESPSTTLTNDIAGVLSTNAMGGSQLGDRLKEFGVATVSTVVKEALSDSCNFSSTKLQGLGGGAGSRGMGCLSSAVSAVFTRNFLSEPITAQSVLLATHAGGDTCKDVRGVLSEVLLAAQEIGRIFPVLGKNFAEAKLCNSAAVVTYSDLNSNVNSIELLGFSDRIESAFSSSSDASESFGAQTLQARTEFIQSKLGQAGLVSSAAVEIAAGNCPGKNVYTKVDVCLKSALSSLVPNTSLIPGSWEPMNETNCESISAKLEDLKRTVTEVRTLNSQFNPWGMP